MKKSLMKTLLLAGCLLAAGRLAYSKFRPVPSHPTQVKATVWQNQAVQASNWQVGHEYLYDFDYTGGGLIAKTSGKNLEYRVQGQLVMAVLYEEGDFFKVWLHLNSENEEGLKTLPVKLRTSLQNSWKTGIFAKLETRGFHWNALTEAGQDGAAYQFWQKLAERMRVNLPVEIRSNPWTQDESLASGSLPVRYEIEANLSSNPIQNEKITLRRTLAGIPAKGRKLKLESLVVLFPNFAGLDSLVYQSQENQDLQGQDFKTETSLRLQYLQKNSMDPTALAGLERRARTLIPNSKLPKQESRIQEIALGAKSFDEIWALISEEKLDTADQDAYLKLKAWIYLHPDEMKTLKEHLQTLADTDLALRLSIRALAAAGHPAAQDVLLGLLQERQANIPLARKLLSTLGFIEEPSPAAQKVLEHLSQSAKDPSLQRSSRLALGIMGQHLKQSPQIDSQERADTILDHAMQRLRAAHTETEITDELASIGNAGPKHVAALKPWLGDSNPKIRGQAYFALRFAEPSETSLFLGSSYLTETLPAVRSQIVQALTLRKIDDEWFQAIQNLVSAGPAANDQLAIAKSLMRGMAINRTKTLDIFQKLQEKTQDGELKRALSSFQAVAEGHNPIL